MRLRMLSVGRLTMYSNRTILNLLNSKGVENSKVADMSNIYLCKRSGKPSFVCTLLNALGYSTELNVDDFTLRYIGWI